MGNLKKNSRAVAGIGIRAGGSAMRETAEQLECVVQHTARSRTVQMGNEAHSTCVVLVGRLVQPLSFRCGHARWSSKAIWGIHAKAPAKLDLAGAGSSRRTSCALSQTSERSSA